MAPSPRQITRGRAIPGRGFVLCLGVALLVVVLRLALLRLLPIPLPSVHDEFSYLLGAETFRIGRLTNPPHPMWVHFETFHVNFQPTYTSKYPPAQALVIAIGWKLFGHPWYGILLSSALMCAALCWMLEGWLPPRYALIGGLMAMAQWAFNSSWVNTYWGGAVAAGAGALVIGAVPRLVRRPSASAAALGSLGAIVLANSRPYEGALVVAAALLLLLFWSARSNRWRHLQHPRVILPAAAILLAGVGAMGYYNYRVTGNPVVMPYTINEHTYAASPVFWMMPPSPVPAYRHEIIKTFWTVWAKSIYDRAHASPLWVGGIFVLYVLPFFLTPLSAIAALVAIFLRRSLKVWLVLAGLAIPTAGLLLERFSLPHYFAPATGLVLLMVMLGVQQLGVRFGTRGLIVFTALFFAGIAFSMRKEYEDPHARFAAQRQAIAERLENQGTRNLILVRYAPTHDIHEEWVYNHADIDGSAVIWARDMGETSNRELLDYYRRRKIWLLEPDRSLDLVAYR